MSDAPAASPTSRRVALFATAFCEYSQTFIFDEARSHERYEVEIFTRRRENADRFPFPEERVHAPGSPLAKQVYKSIQYCAAFHRRFCQQHFDVVHGHFGTGAVYAQRYARRYRRPLVVTFHGYDAALLESPARFRPRRWDYWLASGRLLRESALLLGASQELCDILARVSKRPEAVRLFRLGIDLDRYRRSDERGAVPQVVMVGRFVEKKGHLTGIRAFARALAAGHEARLTLVGEGPLEAEYRREIARLAIEDKVTLAGVRTPDEVATLLGRADVALAPSQVARDGNRESGLLVAKEAAAASVPVVGSIHGGIPEIIDDGETGYLVPERDVEAFADRLSTLLGDAELREKLGVAARAKMEQQYDLRSQVRALEGLYDEVCRSRD